MARGINELRGNGCRLFVGDSAKREDIISVVVIREENAQDAAREVSKNLSVDTHAVVGSKGKSLPGENKRVFLSQMVIENIACIELGSMIFDVISLFPNAQSLISSGCSDVLDPTKGVLSDEFDMEVLCELKDSSRVG